MNQPIGFLIMLLISLDGGSSKAVTVEATQAPSYVVRAKWVQAP